MTKCLSFDSVSGEIVAPPSKSSMQRAVAASLLAEGESILRNPSFCADSLAAMAVAEALGASVEHDRETVNIRGGLDLSDMGLRILSCGESGLCMRMFSPIAALLPSAVRLEGKGTLLARPVSMMEGPLRSLGVECSTRSGFPPVEVRGPLKGGKIRIDGSKSSQFLTGLLMALPLAESDSTIEVDSLASGGYVDLSLAVMGAFGVRAERDEDSRRFRISGRQSYAPRDFTVEGDWSGAAFILVAGAIAARDGELAVGGLSPDSAQPDRAVLDALHRTGAKTRIAGDKVLVSRGNLDPFEFDARGCPDLFPPLVALAAACRGESLIRGAGRLKEKESDRGRVLGEEFAKLGVRVELDGDEMHIWGGRLHGAAIDPRNDHRIAMSCAIASLAASGEVVIQGCECVDKSYPEFFTDLERIAVARDKSWVGTAPTRCSS